MAEQRRLARMLTVSLYNVPIPPGAEGRKQKEAHASEGLAVVVVRALADREWVKEEKLAEELHLGPKQVRKVLHYLEEEGLVRRAQARERKQDRAPITGMTGEEEGAARTYSYCCLDFPRMLDCIRLRLAKLRQRLSDKSGTGDSLTTYRCTGCQADWTELELVNAVQDESGRFVCTRCEYVCEPLTDGLSVRDAESEAARESRRQKLADMRRRAEDQLRPLEEAAERALKGPTLDFGTLQEWFAARRHARQMGAEGLQEQLQEQLERRGQSHHGGSNRQGQGKQQEGASPLDVLQHTQFQVDITDDDAKEEPTAKAARRDSRSAGQLPSWFKGSLFKQEQGESQAEDAVTSTTDDSKVESAQEAYWSAFMAQLRKQMGHGEELPKQEHAAKADVAPPKVSEQEGGRRIEEEHLAVGYGDAEDEEEWEEV